LREKCFCHGKRSGISTRSNMRCSGFVPVRLRRLGCRLAGAPRRRRDTPKPRVRAPSAAWSAHRWVSEQKDPSAPRSGATWVSLLQSEYGPFCLTTQGARTKLRSVRDPSLKELLLSRGVPGIFFGECLVMRVASIGKSLGASLGGMFVMAGASGGSRLSRSFCARVVEPIFSSAAAPQSIPS
jgi:hypothetical protein